MDFNKQEFDLDYWSNINGNAEKENTKSVMLSRVVHPVNNTEDEIREVARQIMDRGIDITNGYSNWLSLGFALADGLGEGGRELYHGLSQFNSGYRQNECDKQYSACLKNHGQGITIKTFFKMAQDAGIDLSEVAREHMSNEFCADCASAQSCAKEYEEVNSLTINNNNNSNHPAHHCAEAQSAQNSDQVEGEITFLQTFSDKVDEDDWPRFLKPVLDSMDDAEGKDKMILGTLLTISGMIPNYYGIYGGHVVFPPLYMLFYGPSASRKGEIGSCINVTKPLRKEIEGAYYQELEDYKKAHADWESKGTKAATKAERGEEPEEPNYRSPIIAANSSASAVYQALENNGGWGIIFETEASVLAQTLLSDYGNFTPGLLAAFHHEPIKMNRVTDKLHINIEKPRLAIGLTCTPEQVKKLFPSFDDGFGNRFLFYGLNRRLQWINPFKKVEKPIDEVYEDLGKESLEIYHLMKKLDNRCIQFTLNDEQIQKFNTFFSELLMEQFSMLGDGIASFIFRLGLSSFRIAMILTILRRYSDWDKSKPFFDDYEQAAPCSDKDFELALTVMNTLVNHTALVYEKLAKESEKQSGSMTGGLASLAPAERILIDSLGDEFTSEDVKEACAQAHINPDTARRYLGKFVNSYHVAERVKNGHYRKTLK